MTNTKNYQDWASYINTITLRLPLKVNFAVLENPEARDGVEVRASAEVLDYESDRRVNNIQVDFPPVFTAGNPALFVRALLARLLLHEIEESLWIGGVKPFNPHTDLPV